MNMDPFATHHYKRKSAEHPTRTTNENSYAVPRASPEIVTKAVSNGQNPRSTYHTTGPIALVGYPVNSKTGMAGTPSSVGMSMVGGAILFAVQRKNQKHNTETARCVDSSLSDNIPR